MAAVSAPAPLVLPSQPHVFIVTLGILEAFVDRRPAVWDGSSAGKNQLRRGLAGLLLHLELPVHRTKLEHMAGGRDDALRRRVFHGLIRMLQSWGMGDAVTKQSGAITLRPHPSWHTDTDELLVRYEEAQHAEAAGDPVAVVRVLEDVGCLCSGEFLDGIVLPEAAQSLADRREYWRIIQRNALMLLARCSLQLPGRAKVKVAYNAALRAREFDANSEELQQLLADAAMRLKGPG